jgi:hypothetical protein
MEQLTNRPTYSAVLLQRVLCILLVVVVHADVEMEAQQSTNLVVPGWGVAGWRNRYAAFNIISVTGIVVVNKQVSFTFGWQNSHKTVIISKCTRTFARRSDVGVDACCMKDCRPHTATQLPTLLTPHILLNSRTKGSVRRCGVGVFLVSICVQMGTCPSIKGTCCFLGATFCSLDLQCNLHPTTPRKPNNTGRKEMEGLDGHQF